MAKRTPSLEAAQRTSILAAHRARGHAVGNLWYVYSIKTNRDWIIRSDRGLIYWIIFLECNSGVRAFNLTPEPATVHCDNKLYEFQFDAEVITTDDKVERHIVRAVNSVSALPDLLLKIIAPESKNPTFSVFTDEELNPHKKVALRWLKAISYATVLRGREYNSYRSSVIAYLLARKSGSVGQLVNDLGQFEEPILLGTLVRLAISGTVKLDFQRYSFGGRTPWVWAG